MNRETQEVKEVLFPLELVPWCPETGLREIDDPDLLTGRKLEESNNSVNPAYEPKIGFVYVLSVIPEGEKLFVGRAICSSRG